MLYQFNGTHAEQDNFVALCRKLKKLGVARFTVSEESVSVEFAPNLEAAQTAPAPELTEEQLAAKRDSILYGSSE